MICLPFSKGQWWIYIKQRSKVDLQNLMMLQHKSIINICHDLAAQAISGDTKPIQYRCPIALEMHEGLQPKGSTMFKIWWWSS